MRFQLNKLGTNDIKNEKDKFRKKMPTFIRPQYALDKYSDIQMQNRSIEFLTHHEVKGFICKNCGAEIYGNWEYLSIFNKLKKEERGGYKVDWFDEIILYEYLPNGIWSSYHIGCYSQSYYDQLVKLINEYNEINDNIKNEMHNFKNTKKCPICNGSLTNEPPFYENDGYGDVDYMFEKKMGKKIAELYKTESIENASSFIESANVKPIVFNAVKEQLSTNALKEYVFNLINLESNIMCLSKRLEQLYFQQIYNNKNVTFEHNYALYDLRQDIDSKDSLLKNSKKELSNFEKRPIGFKKKEYPSKPEYPTLKTPYFFNKKKVEAYNSQVIHDYDISLEKYNLDIKQCDAENEKRRNNAKKNKEKEIKDFELKIENQSNELSLLKKELKEKEKNNDTPSKALGEKHLLDSEIKTVEETLKELFKCRNELYSYNIVFEKYRNIVALSTFYEYLMAGRCETLDGVNGAYNIYENELRLNTIITKLDEIKENQFVIYNKLRDIDNSLSTLNNTMQKAVSSLDTISKNTSDMNVYLDNISKNTAVIAHNSAVTAYYSKVNAELTNALGFMVALK